VGVAVGLLQDSENIASGRRPFRLRHALLSSHPCSSRADRRQQCRRHALPSTLCTTLSTAVSRERFPCGGG
jgi:hypothetical protein